MNKKILVILLIVIVAILGLFILLSNDSAPDSGNATLNVSSEGPIGLNDLINEIKTEDYYEGYNNETVKWMESLGNKYVFYSADNYVIMDKKDADKIPSIYVTDVDLSEIFSCTIIEKHSLGSGDDFKDVLLVKNVKYIGESAHYYDV